MIDDLKITIKSIIIEYEYVDMLSLIIFYEPF